MQDVTDRLNNLCFTNKGDDDNEFRKYKLKICGQIKAELKKKKIEYRHEETLFGNNSKENINVLETAFKTKQLEMREGHISQIAIGNFIGWEDLGVGHSSGLDCRKLDNSIILELKNKYNTCNSGSLKSVLDKLAAYKKSHPETMCVLGIVNPKKNYRELVKTFHHDGEELVKIQGEKLLELVFTLNDKNYSKSVVNYVRDIMFSRET